jgi:Domain of unknown function (DUF222)/HNH endonuclease
MDSTTDARHPRRDRDPPTSEFARTTDELGRFTGGLSNQELAAQITELSGHLNAANHRLLVLIAEFDRRAGWSDGVTKSCAHWLNWQCGLSLGAAREKIRVAHALEQLPKIGAAMQRGQLSYAKVRAITRVADSSTEDYFLNIALSGTAHHVEKLARQFRDVREVAELGREQMQQAHRALRYSWEHDGSLEIRVHLPAETGALVLRAIERGVEEIPLPMPSHEDISKGLLREPPPSWSLRRADALVVMAESFLAHGAKSLAGGDRHHVVVHVDAQTLIERTSGRCEIDDGPSIAAETARRIACDTSVVTIVEDERGEPLDVGRKTRAIPPAMRRALASRDKGCRFPGCTHTRYVDGHHVRHWAEGGETKLSNLVTLCRFHHRAVHEGRLVVERLDDGAWRFSKPDGESLVAVLPQHTRPLDECANDGGSAARAASEGAGWRKLAATHRAMGVEITPATAMTGWRGERMDYGLAIDALVRRAQLAGTWPQAHKNVSAETSCG